MADRIFGIKIKKEELHEEFLKPRYHRLGLHLFCNLYIHPKRAEDILLESRWLNDNGFNMLIKKIKNDYLNQPKGYDLLENSEYMTIFNERMIGWFFENFALPSDEEVNQAAEIFELFPDDLHDMLYESIFGSVMASQNEWDKTADDMLEIHDFLESEKEREQSLMDAVHNFANKFVEAMKDQESGISEIGEDDFQKKSHVPTEIANVVMGVDFNLYPHVSHTFRKQLAQNLFLDENLFPDIHIENILKHNGLCSAAEKFIVGFDCRLKEEVEISYETIMKGILGFRYMLGFISEEEYDELMFKHGFNEDDEEEITLGEKYALEIDLKPFEKASRNKLERLFQVADRIDCWSDTFLIPTEEEIWETLAQAEIDYKDVVCIRYLTDRFKSLENYSINPSDLIKFLNKYKEFLEIEETNNILDAYLKLKES